MEESFDLTPPTPIGRGRPKLEQVTSSLVTSPGTSNLKLHVENMNEQQLEQAIETITENPTTTTIVDITGNENQIKTETTETPNTNESDNNNQQIIGFSTLRSNNPILRFGNPLTHYRLQETPLTRSTRNSPDHRLIKRRLTEETAGRSHTR